MLDNRDTARALRVMDIERMEREVSESKRKIIECLDDRTILEIVLNSCARIEAKLNEINNNEMESAKHGE